VAEHGSTRLFEARKLWVEQKKAEEKQKDEDATDPMKQLEKRTKMSRAEMEALSGFRFLQHKFTIICSQVVWRRYASRTKATPI
jgi:hypothetical protein